MTGSASPSQSVRHNKADGQPQEPGSPDSESGNSWLHLRRSTSQTRRPNSAGEDIPLKSFNSDHSDQDAADDYYDDDDMASRPSLHRPTEGRSQVPLLKEERRGRRSSVGSEMEEGRALSSNTVRSRFRSTAPDHDAKSATRHKWIVAGIFLLISLVSFTVQTQTAVYIQQDLGWNKPYCMLYLTHGSWIFLWPVQLLLLRIRKWKMPWSTFWRRHLHVIRTTAQMVESREIHLSPRNEHKSPVGYMIRTTAIVTSALTIAGGSWYVAVELTTGSDLTAIYNCSAFFAYAFSIPLLNDKFRLDKTFSVVIAVVGVGIVAYAGGATPAGVADGGAAEQQASNRTLGNIVIGIGSVLYGLYEVLYKRMACPPEGTSSGRGVIFANTFAGFIGTFTILFLWIPLPILHWTGLEVFEWPQGEAAWLLLVSTLGNATFSGSFLVLISLTSPVLSSVAALLTIFIVAIVDWKLNHKDLSGTTIGGGVLIIIAFLMLSWSTYRELDEERRKRLKDEGPDSESDD